MSDDGGGMPDFAERLNHLFHTVPGPGGQGSWSNEQAAAELARLGTPMSGAYLSQLRHAKRLNPSARSVGALAVLFDVPVTYFYDRATADRIDHDLPTLPAVRDPGVRAIAVRVHGLSLPSQACVRGVVERLRTLEGLPDVADPVDFDKPEPPVGSG